MLSGKKKRHIWYNIGITVLSAKNKIRICYDSRYDSVIRQEQETYFLSELKIKHFFFSFQKIY